MVLVQKWPFSQFLFLGNIGQRKCLLRTSRKKNCLSKLQKQEVQKVEKFSFFQRGNPWFWSKNGHFSNFFFPNIGQENVFYNILEQQIAFLCYKNKKFKNLKN